VAKRLKWVWYKRALEDARSGLKMVPERAYFPTGEPDQMPDVYYQYKQCKAWNTLWWPGTVADQPHILMDEFMMCQAAEQEFENADLPPMREQHLSLMRAEQERRGF
jgi:hypothetical protein